MFLSTPSKRNQISPAVKLVVQAQIPKIESTFD